MKKAGLNLPNSVMKGKLILVLFASVKIEALKFTTRTQASSSVAMEQNPITMNCVQKMFQMLQSAKKNITIPKD